MHVHPVAVDQCIDVFFVFLKCTLGFINEPRFPCCLARSALAAATAKTSGIIASPGTSATVETSSTAIGATSAMSAIGATSNAAFSKVAGGM